MSFAQEPLGWEGIHRLHNGERFGERHNVAFQFPGLYALHGVGNLESEVFALGVWKMNGFRFVLPLQVNMEFMRPEESGNPDVALGSANDSLRRGVMREGRGEHVLAVFEAEPDVFVVKVVRGGNVYGIHIRIGHESFIIRIHPRPDIVISSRQAVYGTVRLFNRCFGHGVGRCVDTGERDIADALPRIHPWAVFVLPHFRPPGHVT